ncbi:YopT-type cysteine protease domain-containing protein [Bradyrhizobium uaiense]|uniref:YopT-type cysteine protease domain-containing protein n=1 Tax=Bradyrhizobium uaiense TaxID=2594946 RepID=A0A6P1BA43_9BRAD|nr:YopT-type cysteine protease domain-containing protein [Bradyrhizobium uaiense]NEU94302.1 YopT-type cysteine protease domain-containing protein [Bradyrhizobium uaiense]
MYNPVTGQATSANQADELSQYADNSNFEQAFTDLAHGESLPAEELSDKMGLCCSRPHTSDANVHTPVSSDLATSSLSSDSNPASPAEPNRPLFQYRTTELPGANVGGICVGLAAEWLLNLGSSPSSRMSALVPGAQNHASAVVRQQRYEDLKALLRSDRAGGSHNLQAKTTMLREAGLEPADAQTRYKFGTSSRIGRIVNEVTHDPSVYLIGLRFAAGGAHTIASSTSNGMTTLFDPNYGEFTVRSGQMGGLFKSLGDRYSNVNGLDISMVVTQRIT